MEIVFFSSFRVVVITDHRCLTQRFCHFSPFPSSLSSRWAKTNHSADEELTNSSLPNAAIHPRECFIVHRSRMSSIEMKMSATSFPVSLMRKFVLINAVLVATKAFVVVPRATVYGAARIFSSETSTLLRTEADDDVEQDRPTLMVSEEEMMQIGKDDDDASMSQPTEPNSTDIITMEDTKVLDSNTEEILSNVDRENAAFQCDHTVAFWQEHKRTGKTNTEYAQELSSITQRMISKGPEATNYFVVSTL